MGSWTYAGVWCVYITPKAFLLTSMKCIGCREAPLRALAPAVAGEGAMTAEFMAASSDFQHH